MLDGAAVPVSEAERVEAWRLKQLLDAGYGRWDAEELARRADVDLHAAVELVSLRGCDPETAARILA
jgi:hypothetical protein